MKDGDNVRDVTGTNSDLPVRTLPRVAWKARLRCTFAKRRAASLRMHADARANGRSLSACRARRNSRAMGRSRRLRFRWRFLGKNRIGSHSDPNPKKHHTPSKRGGPDVTFGPSFLGEQCPRTQPQSSCTLRSIVFTRSGLSFRSIRTSCRTSEA